MSEKCECIDSERLGHLSSCVEVRGKRYPEVHAIRHVRTETEINTVRDAEIDALKHQVSEMLAIMETFRPLTVDLRIDGVVRPVTLFARDEMPALRVV
jgi:hypothetical protein